MILYPRFTDMLNYIKLDIKAIQVVKKHQIQSYK